MFNFIAQYNDIKYRLWCGKHMPHYMKDKADVNESCQQDGDYCEMCVKKYLKENINTEWDNEENNNKYKFIEVVSDNISGAPLTILRDDT